MEKEFASIGSVCGLRKSDKLNGTGYGWHIEIGDRS
jgi:hypothetical protein